MSIYWECGGRGGVKVFFAGNHVLRAENRLLLRHGSLREHVDLLCAHSRSRRTQNGTASDCRIVIVPRKPGLVQVSTPRASAPGMGGPMRLECLPCRHLFKLLLGLGIRPNHERACQVIA